MKPEWFYRQDGREIGPVSSARVYELVSTGQLRPEQPVWQVDGENRTYCRAEAVIAQVECG